MLCVMNYSKLLNSLIPGGCHTYSRGDDQFPSNAPEILKSGKGAYVFDVDNKKYLDYGMALRSVSLGYCCDKVNKGAIEQINNGNNLTRASLIELEAAKVITELIPSADMVKFAKNGSNVTTGAVKLARAYTNKKYVAICKEHPFFSFDDWFIGTTAIKKGVPEEYCKLTLQFEYNNIESLKKLFFDERYRDNIACVLLEPVTFIEPVINKDTGKNFLQEIRELCDINNSLLILDEMITGFRWHIKGASFMYNVVPDLITFGKAMANGFSLAALCGKKEVMELGAINKDGQERVFLLSSTHGAEMCSLGAFVETVKYFQNNNVIEHLWEYGRKLMDGANNIAKELDISEFFYFAGYPCSPYYFTKDITGNTSFEFRTLFIQEMLKRDIIMTYVTISFAHGQTELQMTMKAIRESLEIYKKALFGDINNYLQSKSIKPVFRKYN